jgi:hypothetical protein
MIAMVHMEGLINAFGASLHLTATRHNVVDARVALVHCRFDTINSDLGVFTLYSDGSHVAPRAIR